MGGKHKNDHILLYEKLIAKVLSKNTSFKKLHVACDTWELFKILFPLIITHVWHHYRRLMSQSQFTHYVIILEGSRIGQKLMCTLPYLQPGVQPICYYIIPTTIIMTGFVSTPVSR